MDNKMVVFSKEEFSEALRPAVYELWLGTEIIYIGYAKHGYRRVFSGQSDDPDDPRDNRARAFARCEGVVIYFYDTPEEARLMEARMIFTHQPCYNTQGKLGTGLRAAEEENKSREEKLIKRMIDRAPTRTYTNLVPWDSKV
jgi:excinuclease UvrABC nuclease subunit